MNWKPEHTLQQVREHIRDNWDKGCRCPACGQHVQLYRYKLYATSAAALMRLYHLNLQGSASDGFYHVRDFAEAAPGRPRAPHFAELRFWDLVRPSTRDERPKKKSSGFWAITEKGKLFVRGSILVQSRILVFNNKFQGFADDSEMINMRDALGNDFDYDEMMNGGVL